MEENKISIPDIIETQYKVYSNYVISSRSLVSIIDGLKPVQRRGLYTAMKLCRNDFVKVAKLTGATMTYHPHGDTSISDAISNLAQRFCAAQNINYFEGKGGFGCKINGPGNGIASPRYTSVKLSDWFDKIMAIDYDLVDMIPSYDNTDVEPKAFLPLVPCCLLNPIHGIAVGFACDILPRNIQDVIHCQINHLDGKGFHEPKPYYDGFKGTITKTADNVYQTKGTFEKRGRKLIITELPIGMTREKYVQILDNLEDADIISSYTDDCTEDFHFTINLKVEYSDEQIYEKFKLTSNLNENLNVIGFDGVVCKMTVTDIIKSFTDYRFKVYLNRYKKIFNEKKEDFEYKKDLYRIINKGLFKKFPELNKDEMKAYLLENEIQEKHIQKIIQTPIYRFNKDEIGKLKNDLEELKKYLENVIKLIKDENLRKEQYKTELKQIKA